MKKPSPDALSLGGLRVLDFSRVLAGPFATQVLAGLGADVIKVEFPGGDPARKVGPHQSGESLYFASVNSSKRGVVVDPKSDDYPRRLARLLDWAEVVVHNFRPDAAEALGLDPVGLLQRAPDLVVVTISGYASSTTWADRPAFDLTVQAESGFMAVTGTPGHEPVRSGVPISDLVAGLWAALAVTSGVVHRMNTGTGVVVEVPLLDASLPLLSYMATAYVHDHVEPAPVGSGHHRLVPYRSYRSRDGNLVIAVLADKFWRPLCDALGLDDLAAEPELAVVAGRRSARSRIDSAIEGACAPLTTKALLERLDRHGVPAAPVLTVGQALGTDYVRQSGRLAMVQAQGYAYGSVQGPFDSRPYSAAPRLGEHSEEVWAMLDALADESASS